jgi:copper/silver efflux system protein
MSPLIRFFLGNRLLALVVLLLIVGAGLHRSPFDWNPGGIPRDPVPVDAIPDLGENQQIVFTEWAGRSPQDLEDQVTYPLTVALLGLPGVRTIRSSSAFGISSIYVIFEDDVEFYWSRSRILEKLASLPRDLLPENVQPILGPDATGLGQIFWYTLEGRDDSDQPAGGWGQEELRSIQDWQVRFALMSVDGVAEVASVGGYVREYQVDVDPDAMRALNVTLEEVYGAVRDSNLEVGAKLLEINRVEYFVRGLGWIEDTRDLEESVIRSTDGVPIRIGDVAHVTSGPALRRGALDRGGADAVGGVVVMRYGENPLQVIKRLKDKIAEISPGLPLKELDDGRNSRVTIQPFYDRSGLIRETLGTLESTLFEEMLITILVVLFLVMNLRASLLISALLPVAVLLTFVFMKWFGVDANIVALSGIAIAIGTIVDMGIVLTENILERMKQAGPQESSREVVLAASSEVGPAILTAVATTIIGFLPVFSMIGAEGKLFQPLALTKTLALVSAVLVTLVLVPPFALALLGRRRSKTLPGASRGHRLGWQRWFQYLVMALVTVLLSDHWRPLGPGASRLANLVFVAGGVFSLLFVFQLFERCYDRILRWCLKHKLLFLSLPGLLCVLGLTIWLGFPRVFGFIPRALTEIGVEPETIETSTLWINASDQFSGLEKQFMPDLDEGSFLFMPTTMPHASMGEARDVLASLDRAIESLPEVELAVGKIGRAESALDPAPLSMVETVVNYLPEYRCDPTGEQLNYRFDDTRDEFVRTASGELIEDEDGRPFRNWRPEIQSPDDIWDEIVRVTRLPGTLSAPKLQPIAARIVMLQSGMRAPMGVKITGPDLETIEEVGLQIESLLKEVPSVRAEMTFADRVVGKPYIEIDVNREEAARYGVTIADVQSVIEIALGGKRVTTTVEGRERYPVRVRYQRERRDTIESMHKVLVPTPGGAQIPLTQLAEVRYTRGPQVIKTEDSFLTSYVLFDRLPEFGEVDVVEDCKAHLEAALASGDLLLPDGVSYAFAGTYENQVRAAETLAVVLPLALLLIFGILFLQFRAVSTTLMVFSGVFVAWSGGFLLIWLYGQPWFLDFDVLGTNIRSLLQVQDLRLSVAVWVGFLALFGIATDDGVVIATYLKQSVENRSFGDVQELRAAVRRAGGRRCRPCLMTTATTILALLPVLTSTGRGADVMIPMAIPAVGGMAVALVTMFVVPVLYCGVQELRWRRARS